jgi:hypothetical protein
MYERREVKSVADLLGPWEEVNFESGLIDRCRRAWNKPFRDLTNEELATLLRQRIAPEYLLVEANHRLERNVDDGTEMFDGELAEVVRTASSRM